MLCCIHTAIINGLTMNKFTKNCWIIISVTSGILSQSHIKLLTPTVSTS